MLFYKATVPLPDGKVGREASGAGFFAIFIRQAGQIFARKKTTAIIRDIIPNMSQVISFFHY